VYQQFKNIKNEQIGKAEAFESEYSFEMAYLAYWIILEKSLKVIEVVRRKEELYKLICEWKNYLEDVSKKTPKKITSFVLQEPEKIPDAKVISEFIGGLPLVIEIMNTQNKNGSTKWRDKRNNIAHQSDSFGSENKYQEYKAKVLSGIDEVELRLREYMA